MKSNRKIIFDIKQKNGKSKVNLKKLLVKWQKRLQMTDWNIDLQIVDFKRTDYRQSGDFIANPKKKTASILMTWNPFRGDEEYTLVHELIHVLLYDYDKSCENELIKNKASKAKHDLYLEKLENLAHYLTRILLGRSDR